MKKIISARGLLAFVFALFLIWPAMSYPREMKSPAEIVYAPLTFSPPKAERVQLENGIVLYLIEDHELPLIQISLVLRTGSVYDPPGLEGLAEITGEVMRTGGTESMSGDEIDELLDLIAADVDVSIERETGSATYSSLKDDLDRGLSIFSRILMKPKFMEKKVARAKELKIDELKRINDSPQKLAFREFAKVLFKGDKRGQQASIESVNRIARQDLIDFHERYFFPSNIMMAVAGDFSKDELCKKIDRYFGSWRSSASINRIASPDRLRKGGLYYLYKDSPQSVFITGQIGPGQRDRNYYAMEVLDFIVGSGGFKSRIFSEVRNKRGLAYSAGSFYSPRDEYGIFGAYAMTRPNATAEVTSVILSILEEIKTSPVDGSVLRWAKDSITNRFVFSFTSAAQIARQQMMIEFDGLEQSFMETFCRMIEEVTADDVKHAAATYFNEETRTIFVLGNSAHFDKPLSTFGEVIKIEKKEGE